MFLILLLFPRKIALPMRKELKSHMDLRDKIHHVFMNEHNTDYSYQLMQTRCPTDIKYFISMKKIRVYVFD